MKIKEIILFVFSIVILLGFIISMFNHINKMEHNVIELKKIEVDEEYKNKYFELEKNDSIFINNFNKLERKVKNNTYNINKILKDNKN